MAEWVKINEIVKIPIDFKDASTVYEMFGIDEERGKELILCAQSNTTKPIHDVLKDIWSRELSFRDKIFITFMLGRFVGRMDR